LLPSRVLDADRYVMQPAENLVVPLDVQTGEIEETPRSLRSVAAEPPIV